jgi:D-lyxose ketol-isomerase
MKRSEVNALIREASEAFATHGWALPPNPRWDVTDFGLGDWERYGLVLVNLAEEPEYCEKLMFAKEGMATPRHFHRKKKEDIICRVGRLQVILWSDGAAVKVDGISRHVPDGHSVVLEAGSRITLEPGIEHEFAPISAYCLIGEVSTANNDMADNIFEDESVGRFSRILEDESAIVRLLNEQ